VVFSRELHSIREVSESSSDGGVNVTRVSLEKSARPSRKSGPTTAANKLPHHKDPSATGVLSMARCVCVRMRVRKPCTDRQWTLSNQLLLKLHTLHANHTQV